VKAGKLVVVKRFPNGPNTGQYGSFLKDVEQNFVNDRPSIVFDFAEVSNLDSGGVDILLHCMEETLKHNGDIKLAGLSPRLLALLEMMRVDRLFEIYNNTSDAIDSFHQFTPSTQHSGVIDKVQETARTREP
jgi:anti-sigma B factor antagonist